MSTNGDNITEDAEMVDCDGEKVVTMMDVLKEQQEFEDDANAVLGGSDDKNCTYTKGYVKRQALYACLTCCYEAKEDPSKRAGVCLACSLHCHENHELIELYTKRNFRCDCGNPKFNSNPCYFNPNKTDLNEDNLYNQNFAGIYCVCNRPYPDPESTNEDDMIQCIICEDWLHASHLDAVVPPNDQYAEMVCKGCMTNYNFLQDYVEIAVNVETEDVDVVNVNGDTINNVTNGELVEETITNGSIHLPENENNSNLDTSKPSDVMDTDEGPAKDEMEVQEENKNESSEAIENIDVEKDDKPLEVECSNEKEKPVENEIDKQNKPVETDATLGTDTNTEDVLMDSETQEQDKQLPTETDEQINQLETETNNQEQDKQLESETDEQNKLVEMETNDKDKSSESALDEQDKPMHMGTSKQDKLLESETAEQDKLLESETAEQDKPLESETAEQDKLLESETAEQDKLLESETAEQDKLLESETAEQDKLLESETAEQDKLLESETAEQDKLLESETAEQDKLLESETAEQDKLLESETAEQDKLLESETAEQDKLQSESAEQDKTLNTEINEQNKSIEKDECEATSLTEDSTDDKSQEKEDLSNKEIKEDYSPNAESTAEQAETKDDVPENEKTDAVMDAIDELLEENTKDNTVTNGTLEDNNVEPENNTNKESNENSELPVTDMESDESTAVNGDSGSDVIEHLNVPKRKLSSEDKEDESTKKPKLEDGILCSRPKNVKRKPKGAVFWPSNFRQRLCACGECIAMYKDLNVLYLTDLEDTVSFYESVGKENGSAGTSQYEKGLEALSSLDRIQQINALTEYNKMRDKLLDFLKSFKDRKEVVKEEDIKAFFAGMKPRREQDGVYFCR